MQRDSRFDQTKTFQCKEWEKQHTNRCRKLCMLTVQEYKSRIYIDGKRKHVFENEISKDNNSLSNASNDIGKDLRTAVKQLEDANDTINVLKEVIKKQLAEIEDFKRNSGNKKMVK